MKHEIFNNYVQGVEEKLWVDLFTHKQEAERKAERCGCPNCKREAMGAEDAFTEEAIRVFGTEYPVDHEEDWVAEQALKTLYRRKPELEDK